MSKGRAVIPTHNKSARKFAELLESSGYAFDRVNSKGICFYTHPSLPEQRVNPRMIDAILLHETRRFQRLIGAETKQDRSKRDAAHVKARAERARCQAAEEYAHAEAERARIVADRDKRLEFFGALTVADMNAIVAQLEKADREMRYWAALMTETPDSGHRGVDHAKHRA